MMKLADKFNLPIITLIDTKGAYAGLASEERHIAEAIAVNLRESFNLKVPIICVIVGEGGVEVHWESALEIAFSF